MAKVPRRLTALGNRWMGASGSSEGPPCVYRLLEMGVDTPLTGLRPTEVVPPPTLLTFALGLPPWQKAFSVLPAMAALRVSIHVLMALTLAATLGAAAGFIGYVFAFVYELPVGASQTLAALGAVLGAELVQTAALRGRRA